MIDYSINRDEVKTEVQEKKIALRGLRLSVLTLSLLVGLYIMIVKCEYCNKEFNKNSFRIKKDKHHFCSAKCLYASRKGKGFRGISKVGYGKNNSNWKGGEIKTKCDYCGKKIYVIPANFKKAKHHFCSRKCFGKWSKNRKRKKSFNWRSGKVKRICPACSKEFYVYPSRIKKGYRIFCSHKCHSESFKKSRIKCICKTCGKSFERKPSQIKYGGGGFCSHKCSQIYQIKHFPHANTSIELKVKGWLDELNIPYEQQALIKGICRPDFLLSNKVVIQVDGDYWHSSQKVKNRDLKQDFLLGFKGYKVLRLWEHDINEHPKKCIRQIIENLYGKGVLNPLYHKHRIINAKKDKQFVR